MSQAAYEDLAHGSYAKVTGREVTPELIEEYQALLKTHKSNSAIFVSLGFPSSYLSDLVNSREGLYRLTDADIPEVLKKLKDIVPISIFSNTRLNALLPTIGIDPAWFTNLLGPDVVKHPKPAPDGFLKMIELSGVSPQEILYIGDDVEKDLLPAKQAGISTGLLWKASDVPEYCFKNFQEILAIFS